MRDAPTLPSSHAEVKLVHCSQSGLTNPYPFWKWLGFVYPLNHRPRIRPIRRVSPTHLAVLACERQQVAGAGELDVRDSLLAPTVLEHHLPPHQHRRNGRNSSESEKFPTVQNSLLTPPLLLLLLSLLTSSVAPSTTMRAPSLEVTFGSPPDPPKPMANLLPSCDQPRALDAHASQSI